MELQFKPVGSPVIVKMCVAVSLLVFTRLQRKLTTLLSDGQTGSSTPRPFFGPRGLSAARSVDRGHIACIVVGVSAKCK